MKNIVILIGIPGSGKSTVAKKLENRGYTRLSADKIRGILYGDEGIQGDFRIVFDTFDKELEKSLKNNEDIVIDNTNIRAKDRHFIRDLALHYGYKVKICLINTPLDICLTRNKNRDRFVPEDIILKFHKNLINCLSYINKEADMVINEDGISESAIRVLCEKK